MSTQPQPLTAEQATARRMAAAKALPPLFMLAAMAGLATVVGVSFLFADPTARPAWITVLIAAPLTVVGAVGARRSASRLWYRITVPLSRLRLLGIFAAAALLIWGLGELSVAVDLQWGKGGLRAVVFVALAAALRFHLTTSTLFHANSTGMRFRRSEVPWSAVSHLVITAGRTPGTTEIGAAARAAQSVTPMPIRDGEVLTDLPWRVVVHSRLLNMDRLRWALDQSDRTDLALVERSPEGERVLSYANR